MLNVQDYKLVKESTAMSLQNEVNHLIQQGYQPFGPPSIANLGTHSTNPTYIQAMVLIKAEGIGES